MKCKELVFTLVLLFMVGGAHDTSGYKTPAPTSGFLDDLAGTEGRLPVDFGGIVKIFAIGSSQPTQISGILRDTSIFTRFVIRCFKDSAVADRDRDGAISVEELYIYTNDSTIAQGQTPKVYDNYPGAKLTRAPEEGGVLRAWLIYNAHYRGFARDLVATQNDVNGLQTALTHYPAWAASNIVIHHDLGANEIAGNLEQALNSCGPKDLLLFYYSGHGETIADDNGDEGDGIDEALFGVDGLKLRDDAFRLRVQRWRDSNSTAGVVFVLDNCYSGGTAERGPSLLASAADYIAKCPECVGCTATPFLSFYGLAALVLLLAGTATWMLISRYRFQS